MDLKLSGTLCLLLAFCVHSCHGECSFQGIVNFFTNEINSRDYSDTNNAVGNDPMKMFVTIQKFMKEELPSSCQGITKTVTDYMENIGKVVAGQGGDLNEVAKELCTDYTSIDTSKCYQDFFAKYGCKDKDKILDPILKLVNQSLPKVEKQLRPYFPQAVNITVADVKFLLEAMDAGQHKGCKEMVLLIDNGQLDLLTVNCAATSDPKQLEKIGQDLAGLLPKAVSINWATGGKQLTEHDCETLDDVTGTLKKVFKGSNCDQVRKVYSASIDATVNYLCGGSSVVAMSLGSSMLLLICLLVTQLL